MNTGTTVRRAEQAESERNRSKEDDKVERLLSLSRKQGSFPQLYDPRNGDLSLRVEPLGDREALSAPQRTNYFTMFWVQDGTGRFRAESGQFSFGPNTLLFLGPYQGYRFECGAELRGLCLHFHANFLCIETYHEEVGCNGVLFNDTYGTPCVRLDDGNAGEVAAALAEIQRELSEGGLAQSEALLSHLKLFLIRATRWKMRQQEPNLVPQPRMPETLRNLKPLIEEHYRKYHAPAHYAELLHITPKALARLVRSHFDKTLTELIRERVMRQAKWELLHTLKPVKEVAVELGFEDALYFSRLFKQATGCSPTFYREFETEIRGGRNLSMRSQP